MQEPVHSRDGLQRVHGAPKFIWRILCVCAFSWQEGPELASNSQRDHDTLPASPQIGPKPLMGSSHPVGLRPHQGDLRRKGRGWCATAPGNFSGSAFLRQSPVIPRRSTKDLRSHHGGVTAMGDRLYTIGLPPEISFKECFPLLWRKEGGG